MTNSKIGAPRGMNYSQYLELDNEYKIIDGGSEPLGIGLLRLYYIHVWSYSATWANGHTIGSHPFFIPTLLHDFELISDKRFCEICERLALYNKSTSLKYLVKAFKFILFFYNQPNYGIKH